MISAARQCSNFRQNTMTDLNLSPDIQEFLERPTTTAFLLFARQFVTLLETDIVDKANFLKRSHGALTDLYAAGHKLEEIPLKYSSADSEFDGDEFFKDKTAIKIPDLGEDALYWEVFDPTYMEKDGQPGQGWKITDKEPSQGWLVDDLTDIYRDLKIELNKIDTIVTDEAIEDALWQMKWSFFHHWGSHCVNALRYLHYMCYDGKNIM
jgi:hypothetical protein